MAGEIEISDDIVRTYRRAAIRCAASHGPLPHRGECCDRAGLAAVVPLIRAQVAAEHRCVTVVEEGPPEFFIDDHDMAAIGMFEPDEPVADVQAAFEAGEKGETKRPLSNREFIAAEVERLGLQPKVDAWWAEIENAPPPPPGWCTWHQTYVAECAGDTDECREAKAELNEPNGDTP